MICAPTLVLGRVLPSHGREVGIGFGAQMRAVGRLALTERVLRWRAMLGVALIGWLGTHRYERAPITVPG
jgi:hypothetical protein